MDQKLNQISKEQFLSLFHSLPQDIKLSLFAEETAEQMLVMKSKHSLSDESFSNIVRVTGRIMLGMINVKLFIQAIIDGTKLDVAKAQAIAQDINQAIFQPVRQSLMQVHNITERGSTPINTRIDAELKRDTNTLMRANDTNRMTNNQVQMPNQVQSPNIKYQQPLRMVPPANEPDYEAARRRNDVLSKLKNPPTGPTARPAGYSFLIPPRRSANNTRKKRKYNGFFNA